MDIRMWSFVVQGLVLTLSLPGLSGAAVHTPAASNPASLQIEIGAHVAPVRRLAVDKVRKLVVTASEDKTARLWSLETGELLHIFRPTSGKERQGILYGAAMHPFKSIIALGGSTGGNGHAHQIHLFNYVNRRYVRSINAVAGDVKNLAWDSTGQYLFATYAGDNAVRAFDWAGEIAIEHRFKAASYALSADKRGNVVAASLDGRAIVFSTAVNGVTKKLEFSAGPGRPVSASISSDSTMIAVGFNARMTSPKLFDLASGRLIKALRLPGISDGAIERVRWTGDNKTLIVAGRGYLGKLDQVPMFWLDIEENRVLDSLVVAGNSVTELSILSANEVVFSSFDGGWGVASRSKIHHRIQSAIPEHRDPGELLVSANADVVAWSAQSKMRRRSFSFRDRVVSDHVSDELLSPKFKQGIFDNPKWKNTRRPQINGYKIELALDEISRAFSYVRSGSDDAFLGTSRRLLRLNENGQIVWSVKTAGEVRAVNVSSDDRIVVTAMSDGTIRWWKALDGTALLSFLGLPSDKWVVWTANGYYDSSLGADQFTGWSVNRSDEGVADFFSLNKFRSVYNRPLVIDEILLSLSEARAVGRVKGRKSAGSEVRLLAKSRPLSTAPDDIVGQIDLVGGLPPIFEHASESLKTSRAGSILVPYRIRSKGSELTVSVRINGRPVSTYSERVRRTDSTSREGEVSIERPSRPALIQLIAKNHYGVGESRAYRFMPKPDKAPFLQAVKKQAWLTKASKPDHVDKVATAVKFFSSAISPVESSELEIEALPVVPTMPGSTVGSSRDHSQTVAMTLENAPSDVSATLHVLAIGVSDYKNDDYELEFAAKDALDIGRAFKLQEGRQFGKVIVTPLLDRAATKRNIEDQLSIFKDSVAPDDTGVLFIAGHGVTAKNGKYYYLPHDTNLDQLAKTAVSEESLRRALAGVRGKALMLVDTCYGGNSLSRAGSVELAGLANDLSSPENGVIVFAASSGRQLSEENASWNNGAFTSGILAGLRGKADPFETGQVTVIGLIHYVSQHVKKLTQGRQTPVAISPAGVPDYPIIRL